MIQYGRSLLPCSDESFHRDPGSAAISRSNLRFPFSIQNQGLPHLIANSLLPVKWLRTYSDHRYGLHPRSLILVSRHAVNAHLCSKVSKRWRALHCSYAEARGCVTCSIRVTFPQFDPNLCQKTPNSSQPSHVHCLVGSPHTVLFQTS